MDRFDKLVCILLAIMVVSVAATAVGFWKQNTRYFDDFELTAGDGMKFASKTVESINRQGAASTENSESSYVYYYVNSVSAGTVSYTKSLYVDGVLQTTNSSAPLAKFLKYEESDYTSLPHYKSQSTKNTVAKCEYGLLDTICHEFRYSNEEGNQKYEATCLVYVCSGYVVLTEKSEKETGDGYKWTFDSRESLNDIYLDKKSVKNSEVAPALTGFTPAQGKVLTWTVTEKEGSTLGHTDTETRYMEKCTIDSVTNSTIQITVETIPEEGSSTVVISTIPLTEFTGIPVDQQIIAGYLLDHIEFKKVTLGDLGNALTITTVLTKDTGSSAETVTTSAYNGQMVQHITLTEDEDGHWTSTTKTLIAIA